MVTHEKLQKLKGRLDKYQSKSLSWYEEHCSRITSSFFVRICRRLSSPLPELHCEFYFESAYVQNDATVRVRGRNNEGRVLSAYKQV